MTAQLKMHTHLRRILPIVYELVLTGEEKIPVYWEVRFRIAERAVSQLVSQPYNLTENDFLEIEKTEDFEKLLKSWLTPGQFKCLSQVMFGFDPRKYWDTKMLQ